jgi:hypothetical protein
LNNFWIFIFFKSKQFFKFLENRRKTEKGKIEKTEKKEHYVSHFGSGRRVKRCLCALYLHALERRAAAAFLSISHGSGSPS